MGLATYVRGHQNPTSALVAKQKVLKMFINFIIVVPFHVWDSGVK
jgi:hypothetical protein